MQDEGWQKVIRFPHEAAQLKPVFDLGAFLLEYVYVFTFSCIFPSLQVQLSTELGLGQLRWVCGRPRLQTFGFLRQRLGCAKALLVHLS